MLREVAERCDLVIAGEDEAVLLCGSADPAVLADRFGVEAVVKLGARGAAGCRDGETADDAGIDVAPVDVVGAGDAFTAGYLDALLDGAGLRRRRCAARTPAARSPSPPSATPPACRPAASSSGCWRAAPTSSASLGAVKVAIVGGGVVGLCSAYALKRAGAEVVLLERGALGRGASEGNTGWISPTISTPLAAPGVLRSGLRSAFDPRGALVFKPGLDTAWLRWLWAFRAASARPRYRRGVKALLDLNGAHVQRARRLRGRRRRVRDARRRHPLPGAHASTASRGSRPSSRISRRSASRARSSA